MLTFDTSGRIGVVYIFITRAVNNQRSREYHSCRSRRRVVQSNVAKCRRCIESVFSSWLSSLLSSSLKLLVRVNITEICRLSKLAEGIGVYVGLHVEANTAHGTAQVGLNDATITKMPKWRHAVGPEDVYRYNAGRVRLLLHCRFFVSFVTRCR